jgi:hypothetical protein
MMIPAPDHVELVEHTSDSRGERPIAMPSGTAQHKECPFCGEQVLGIAKKCKHCGEILDVALRAAQEAKKHAELSRRDRGASSAAAASTTVVVHGQSNFPHVLHLILTLLTCGLWFPVWIIHYLVTR